MIKGIGIDIIEVERIANAIASQSFTKRVFTEGEQELILARKNDPQTAAGIFAAKEACAKALGRGFGEILHKDIEVTHNELGAPQIVLYNEAQKQFEKMGGTQIFITLSHIKETAIAECLIEGLD